MTAPAAPGSSTGNLKDQWKLALKGNRDRKLSRLDLGVLIEVIDRFYQAKGNSRASSRWLADKLRAGRPNVLISLRKLQALGYLEETRKGHGTRPTEYRPRFELASGNAGDTTKGVDASGNAGDTTGGLVDNTTTAASGNAGDTESYLRNRLTRAGLNVSRTSDEEGTRGAASPPPLCASAGAGAGTPRDPGFEELWTAYAFKQERKKAKAAYLKLNPDVTLTAQMVAAAKAWASSYEHNGTEPKWRKKLHTWIDGESWLEDPPLPYESPKAAAIANKRGGKAKGKAPTAASGKADNRTAPPKVRAKPKSKPIDGLRPAKAGKGITYTQKWLGKQVAGGLLSVPEIAQLIAITEQDVQSILDGRANVDGGKWRRLQCAADAACKSRAPRAAAGGGAGGGAGHHHQAINGAASSRSVDPTVPTTPPTWTDNRAWVARVEAAGPVEAHRVVLGEWAVAAGGRSVGDAIHLPADLPLCIAQMTLTSLARMSGLRVHTDAPARPTAAPTTTGPFTRAPASP